MASRDGDDRDRPGWRGDGNAGHHAGSQPGGSSRAGSHHDPDYLQWREKQANNLDNDYLSWRQERLRRFSDEFNHWRASRGQAQGGKGSDGSSGSAGTNRPQ